MKKVFFTLLAVAAISSCSNEMEVSTTPVASDKLITFEAPIVAPTTRGLQVVETTEMFPTTWTIKVWAKWHEENYNNDWDDAANKPYMTGVLCSNEGPTDGKTYTDPPVSQTGWYPADAYYWPKNGKLTFQAVSQDKGDNDLDWATVAENGTGVKSSAAEATGYPFSNVGEQFDLMYSDIATNKTPGYTVGTNTDWDLPAVNRSYEGVQLMFHHACSNILFKAGTKEDYSATTTIKIQSIRLLGMYKYGNFAQNYTETEIVGPSIARPAYSSKPTWTPVGTDEITYNSALTDVQVVAYNGGTLQALSQQDLVVMPQTMRPCTTTPITDGVRFEIIYTIQTNHNPEITQQFIQPLNLLTYSSGNKAFEPGKQYTFNIVFSLDEIYFSPEVTNWTDVTVEGFDQDGNTPVAPVTP